MKFLHCLFFSLITLIACRTESNKSDKSNNNQADSLTFHYETYRLESKHLIKNDDSQDTTYFQAQYPVFDEEEINTMISKYFSANSNPDTTYTSTQAEAKAFIDNFDDFIQMDEYPRAWYFDTKTTVLAQTPLFLSTALEWSEYSGGAHGNYGTIYYNYDLHSLDTLTLDSIISPSNQEQLRIVGEKVFRQQEKLGPAETLDSYFFEDNKFSLNTNFTLTSKGLLFLYNIYEIKPYVSGTTEILLPYADIQQLLTEKGKIIQAQLSKKYKKVNASI